MYRKGDFHIHTTASDGKLSPNKIVKLATEYGFDIIAITDHDTTDGLNEALKASEKYNIRVVPGIELSTIHNEESIHVLGYFRDDSYKNNGFQNFLTEIKTSRISRAKKMINNLDKYFDIKLDFNKIYEEAEGVIARPHIANEIIASGYDYTWNYIFDNIISNDSPAYVHNKKVSLSDGISLLKKYNAIVVLAHPVLIKKTKIEELLKFDFDGIEAIYPQNTKNETKKLKALAKKYNKLITAGSDFHGGINLDTKHANLGKTHLDCDRIQIFLDNLDTLK